jgi:hypothetical protein
MGFPQGAKKKKIVTLMKLRIIYYLSSLKILNVHTTRIKITAQIDTNWKMQIKII